MTSDTPAKMQTAYEAVQAFQDGFDAQYVDVLDVYHVHGSDDPEWPDAMVKVVIDAAADDTPGESQYTYPACNFGRNHGLYVFDHVVARDYEVENAERTQGPAYDTDCIVTIRFGVDTSIGT